MKANAPSIRPNRPTSRRSTATRNEEHEIAEANVSKAIADIKAVQSIIDQMVVYAPVASQVYQRNVEPGEYVSPGVPLVTLIDLDDMWIHFDLREDLVRTLKIGDRFERAHPGARRPPHHRRGQADRHQGRICELARHPRHRRFRPAHVLDPRLPGRQGAGAASRHERLSGLADARMRRRRRSPGSWLVARREWRWLLHDRAALILIFGVPLFAFAVLTAVFSHPVIRGLGVVVVDADRSETSRAFVEQVAASPGLSIVERAGDLASAARAIRAGDAIGAVYIPADFERDLKAERRPQVVAFYNQQFLTAAGIASSGLSDSLAAASQRGGRSRAAPKASRIGSLVAETIVLVNPQRNYAQFLLRTLLPMVLHVVIAIAAGYAVGSEFRRRSMRTWLACAGGNPIVALAGKLAPLVRDLLRHHADRCRSFWRDCSGSRSRATCR